MTLCNQDKFGHGFLLLVIHALWLCLASARLLHERLFNEFPQGVLVAFLKRNVFLFLLGEMRNDVRLGSLGSIDELYDFERRSFPASRLEVAAGHFQARYLYVVKLEFFVLLLNRSLED